MMTNWYIILEIHVESSQIIYYCSYCPQSEAVLPSLRRSSSQFSIVDGLSEASQPHSEYWSHPFGYTDPRTAYKRMQRYKKVILI